MAQIRNPLDEVRIPFAKMSYTPDVPSTALAPNEYNIGSNVESDFRGIRSVAGDELFFESLTGTPTYITGGFRADPTHPTGTEFWFIVATTEGFWYASYDGTWQDITPVGGDFSQYAQNTNFTEAWNGTVPIFNDTFNPPMVWLDGAATLTIYSNLVPADIGNIAFATATTQLLTFSNIWVAPIGATTIVPGDGLNGAPVGRGRMTVSSLTSGTIDVNQFVIGDGSSVVASNTQVIGNIDPTGWIVSISQTTTAAGQVQGGPYSQAPYSLGDEIVITDTTNAFNGTFTVVSSTIHTITYTATPPSGYVSGGVVSPKYSWNYNPYWSSVTAGWMRMYNTPNVGSILVAGALKVVYAGTGVEEEFPVTVQWSQAFGLNQAPLTWEPTVTNVANQLEVPLRGQALDAFSSNGQLFVCSYWDTVVFSPINYSTTSAPILGVRLYTQNRGLLSSNCWSTMDQAVYGVDARDIWAFDGGNFRSIGSGRVKNWFYDQLDPVYYDRVFMRPNSAKNQIEIYYPDADATGGVPNKMLAYRVDIDCWNAPRDVSSATFACESPIYTFNSIWEANRGSRTLVYAQGVEDSRIVQKDIGFTLADGGAITSVFRRDNIKMIKDYSGKLMVHRILPEAVNIGATPFSSTDEISIIPSLGNISVKIEGAQSVGQLPTTQANQTMALNTDYPWIQMDQNAYRVNSIELGNTSSTDVWMCNATTWQFTQVEDDR
jgi:hypothetical protein